MMQAGATPRVADLLVDAFVRAGTETTFAAGRGDPMGNLIDTAGRRGVRLIDAASRATACVMAAVTGLLTDAPGVAVLTLDDSEREILAAVEQATRDGAPLVLVTDRPFIGPVGDVVKASLVVAAGAAAHWSAHACQLALAEPRGPVHLVVSPGTAVAPAVPLATSVRPGSLAAPAPALLDEVAEVLAQARHPILIAGRQCRTVAIAAWVRALAESLPAPSLVTAGGKGALPDPHPLHLGLVNQGAAGEILDRADLAVAIGLDARELHEGVLPLALPILHLAASHWARPDRPPLVHVVGEIALLIEELAPRLRGRSRADWDVAELDRLKRAAARPHTAARHAISTVVGLVREATSAGTVAIAAADDETDAVVAAWQAVAPGELVAPTSPRLPGFAIPAGIAAAIGHPGAHVVCFASAREVVESEHALNLATRLALPVLVLVVGEDGAIGADTLLHLGAQSGWTTAMARAALGVRMALEQALSSARPALIDARISRG